MSYQVIARKYRPQRFADVVGQQHVTDTLSRAIEQNRIAHAYLFCGPRGTGKTTVARIFAKCLNCTGGPKVDFDDGDSRVQEITEGRAIDVLEIDGASNNGVEQVRELRETCKYAPASSKFKIYIIDEVHMLSTAAFNALLKTLEEPPAHVKFMFATTDPEKVLPTILSRCQRFDLRRIPTSLIVKQLSDIAGKENVAIDEAALYAIARGADGGMRDAESALDQLISFCGSKIEEPDVLSMFGLTAQGQILGLSQAVLTGDIPTALQQLNILAQNGKDLGRLLGDLLSHFRNLLLFQVSRGDMSLLEVSEAEGATLKEQAAMASPEGFTRILEVLTDTELRLRDASSKKILMEVALLKAIEARHAVNLDAVLKQLNALRGSGDAPPPFTPTLTPTPTPAAKPSPTAASFQALKESVAAPQPTKIAAAATSAPAAPLAPPQPAPQPPAAPATSAAPVISGAALEELWAKVVEGVTRASKFTGGYLISAHPVSFAKHILTIGFDPEFEDQLSLVDHPRNHAIIQTKLAELGHSNCQVKFVKAEAPADRAPFAPPPAAAPATSATTMPPVAPAPTSAPLKEKSAAVPFKKEDFKNDPLIQKALEIFKGQIVEVRT
jgi:DNA polymerase III subunit gamma/tau